MQVGHSINAAHPTHSDVDDASRLSWKRSDDVTTGGGQSAADADLDTLIDRYGRLNTSNASVDTKSGTNEVQQLIKV